MKITEIVNSWIVRWTRTWRQFPIAVWGFDVRRWENQQFEFWLGEFIKRFIFMKSFPDKGPTHLQYQSPFGFLVQWPLCFHVWCQFRKQQTRISDGNVVVSVPGSEKVAYLRVGIVRWDSGDGKYVYGYPWFPLGTFYIGLHWD